MEVKVKIKSNLKKYEKHKDRNYYTNFGNGS